MVAPKLSREEELYAISLSDLARSSLGDDAAAVISGEIVSSPLSPLRLLLSFLSSADTVADGTLNPQARDLLKRAARQVQAALPASGVASSGSAVRAAASSSVDDMVEILGSLSAEERKTLRETVDRVAGAVRQKLIERLQALA